MLILWLLLMLPLAGAPCTVLAPPAAEDQLTKLDAVRSRISGLRAQMQSTSGEKSALS